MSIDNYKRELDQAKTLGEVLKIVVKYYDVESCKISPITKGTIIYGLNTAVKITNCKMK